MASGGPRQGSPGKNYPSRSDLQLNRAAPGQTYGKAAAQERALKAVPAAAPPAPVPGGGGGGPGLMDQALNGWEPLPGSPTQDLNPGKPVTSGLDLGPGPDSSVLPSVAPPQAPRDPVGESIADLYHALISLDDNPSIVDAQFARMLRLGFDQNG